MLPLTELVRQVSPDFLNYLGKKTSFVINNVYTLDLYYFWNHLERQLAKDLTILSKNKQDLANLEKILENFSYLSPNEVDEEIFELEKKYSWIFRHPDGGIFIPLEILKSFLRFKLKTNRKFLFRLLYDLGFSEQKNLMAFVGLDLEALLLLSFEKNPYDMALVLYFYFAELHLSQKAQMPKKVKILKGPWKKTPTLAHLPFSFPEEPYPFVEYLNTYFSEYQNDIVEILQYLEKNTRSFYRPLSLLKNPQTPFCQLFRQGYLLPILPKTQKRTKEWYRQIMLVTPQEILHTLQNKN